MPNFYLDIIDTQDDTHTTVFEKAAKDSIVLSWQGSDEKDELKVVGSGLSFTMEVLWSDNIDAYFGHLFTGDETRYKIELRRESDDLLIWQGFMLPDSYEEPYYNGTFFCDFKSTDGLGRLKGKKLPDDFYTDEKSVIEIISKCLELTGLQMPLIMAPGIDNKVQKNWQNIYLDGVLFMDKDKKLDAFKILDSLCNDTVSCVYQHLGNWYFEGLNKRELQSYVAKKYAFDGAYISDHEVVKVVKIGINKFTTTPTITMLPPYNEISVVYEAASVSFKETQYEEVNDGWIADDSITGAVYATEWYAKNGFNALAKKPNYQISLPINRVDAFDATKNVSLKNKIYLKKNQKIKLVMKFTVDPAFQYRRQQAIDEGYRNNNFKYEVKLNTTVLYTNLGTNYTTFESINFENDDVELGFEFIAQENGLFDIILYQPYGKPVNAAMLGVFLDEFEISEIAFNEDGYVLDVISEDYTIDKEVELTYTDNAAGLGSVFILAKLKQNNPLLYNTIEVPISYTRTFEGSYYAIVSLQGANLIADNIEGVYMNGALLQNVEVFYNFNNGEEMVIKTDLLYTAGDIFTVRAYKIKDHTLDRTYWESWTDSVYQVENKRYANAVVGVYRRLFDSPKVKIDGNSNMPILFGDLVNFNYLAEQKYCIVNCNINFDNGSSNITMVKAGYAQAETGNLPPFVDAGPDIYLLPTQTNAFLDATAFDPDGVIVAYLWEKLSGPAGDIIVSINTEDTNLYNLAGDAYEYKITVTDNDGLTASDTVKVLRQKDYNISLEQIDYNQQINEDPFGEFTTLVVDYLYNIVVDPSLPSGSYINFTYAVNLIISTGTQLYFSDEASVIIYKNGVNIGNYYIGQISEEDFSGVLNFTAGDVIQIALNVTGEYYAAYPRPKSKFTLATGSLFNTPGAILGLPIIVVTSYDL